MSVFETFKRIIQGKPPFEVPQEVREKDATPQAETDSIKSQGPKRIPQVEVEDIDCHEHGNQMQCLAEIQNNFDEPIELDKIRLLGTMRELDTTLRPGEQRQFEVFYNNRPSSNYDTRCELYYKDQRGDYFCAIHYLEFEKLQDNTYIISRVRFVPPVKDV